MTQKFQGGDLVHVAKDLGRSMKHFTADVDAVVIGSYRDQFGGNNTQYYTLHLKGRGQVSWYHEHQLELLERNRVDLITTWEAEEEAERKQKADIDWIFAHGPEVLKECYSASIVTLAQSLGITNLWGSHGEGLVYYTNVMNVHAMSTPFLMKKDKEGWLLLCKKVKLERGVK